jgi:tyrosine-protein phosphatase YwqE
VLDFHNHIIPGIDDGSPDSETSLGLLKGLIDLGYTEFIFTPHIIADTHPNSPESIQQGFDLLNTALDQNNLKFNRSFAAEYMLDDIFSQKLRNKEPFLKLVNDKILVEFSYIQRPDHVEKFSFDLQIQGYEPILAHPERYMYYHNNWEYNYNHLKDLGFELQLNLLSLTPYYGKEIQKIAHKMLNAKMFDFACTDIHHYRHLQALQDSFTKDSLKELFDKFNFRNHELLKS